VDQPTVIAVRREIDPEQARVVRQIFQWYAEGFSAKWIAGELNRLEVASPGAACNRKLRRRDGVWLASAVAGDPRRGRGILNNELYRGVYIWNRSRWVRDPETRQRVSRERPQSEWIARQLPELRIVSDELWQWVRARQAETNRKSEAIRAALHRNARTGRAPKYLLSGLMRNRKRASQPRRELTPEPDPRDLEYFNELVGRDIERFHRLVATDRLADILTNIAGLADARDPDATALLNAVNPPSRREH
jgi:hypothetical protein